MRELPPYSQNQLDEDMQPQQLAAFGTQLGQGRGAPNASWLLDQIAGRPTLVTALHRRQLKRHCGRHSPAYNPAPPTQSLPHWCSR
jgi:hypothetical protein